MNQAPIYRKSAKGGEAIAQRLRGAAEAERFGNEVEDNLPAA